MDDYTRTAILTDIYGALLTDKQRETLLHYLNDDCSLFEIAEQMNMTRQAAHDIIKRSTCILENYEEKLGLYKKLQNNRKLEKRIIELVEDRQFDKAFLFLHEIVES